MRSCVSNWVTQLIEPPSRIHNIRRASVAIQPHPPNAMSFNPLIKAADIKAGLKQSSHFLNPDVERHTLCLSDLGQPVSNTSNSSGDAQRPRRALRLPPAEQVGLRECRPPSLTAGAAPPLRRLGVVLHPARPRRAPARAVRAPVLGRHGRPLAPPHGAGAARGRCRPGRLCGVSRRARRRGPRAGRRAARAHLCRGGRGDGLPRRREPPSLRRVCVPPVLGGAGPADRSKQKTLLRDRGGARSLGDYGALRDVPAPEMANEIPK